MQPVQHVHQKAHPPALFHMTGQQNVLQGRLLELMRQQAGGEQGVAATGRYCMRKQLTCSMQHELPTHKCHAISGDKLVLAAAGSTGSDLFAAASGESINTRGSNSSVQACWRVPICMWYMWHAFWCVELNFQHDPHKSHLGNDRVMHAGREIFFEVGGATLMAFGATAAESYKIAIAATGGPIGRLA